MKPVTDLVEELGDVVDLVVEDDPDVLAVALGNLVLGHLFQGVFHHLGLALKLTLGGAFVDDWLTDLARYAMANAGRLSSLASEGYCG